MPFDYSEFTREELEQRVEEMTNSYLRCNKELKQYKHIEEKLNTNFNILYKAKKQGIYRRMANGIEFFPSSQLIIYLSHIMTESGKQLYMFEYGDEWALTKEELE